MRRALVLLALAPWALVSSVPHAPAGSGLPTVPLYAQFGDWLIACDNGRRCEARGLGPVAPKSASAATPAMLRRS
jgi:hypothetical protein